jgi:hypothetical protein
LKVAITLLKGRAREMDPTVRNWRRLAEGRWDREFRD